MARSTTPKRASHSLDAVLREAVALLDEDGESALTFRALAARLGGGVASIYWYVSNKDELLDRASDYVLVEVLETPTDSKDPFENIRRVAIGLFEVVAKRPWLGAYFMRNANVQPNALAVMEKIGQQTLSMDLTPGQRFDAVSTIIGFVVGTAADLGQQPPAEVTEGKTNRDEYLEGWADRWRALDSAEFPFITHIADVFSGHDDAAQFRSGLDLILAGLELKTKKPAKRKR